MPAFSQQSTLDALNRKGYTQAATDPALTTDEQSLIQLYQPDQSLVIYGTLAPGRPNHGVVFPIRGQWQTGTIEGQLADAGWGAALGYYGLLPRPTSPVFSIAVHVLRSDELARYWPMLDKFEGDGYQRMLIAYRLDGGGEGVGHIYALRSGADSPR